MPRLARVKVSMELLREVLELPDDVTIHDALMEDYDYRNRVCTLIIEKPDFPKIKEECSELPLVEVVFTEIPRKVDVDFRFPYSNSESP